MAVNIVAAISRRCWMQDKSALWITWRRRRRRPFERNDRVLRKRRRYGDADGIKTDSHTHTHIHTHTHTHTHTFILIRAGRAESA